MTEADQIARTTWPVTVASLSGQLRDLGLAPGDLVLVHSSLSALGWVNGGAAAVIQALLASIGATGTLCMPAHSADLTDPANWQAPPVPATWLDLIRNTMPAFDARTTPTRDMGKIAELFRTWPGALRSHHPAASFAALGPLASAITAHHRLDDPLGPTSPLGALYRLGARILLVGVDFDTCTALHLAEQLVWPDRAKIREGAPILVDGARTWTWFEVPPLLDGSAFLPVGHSALEQGLGNVGPLGQGRGILIDFKQLVDHATQIWSTCPPPASSAD